jgi:predicted dinucleotide-binding enzyme
MTTAIIGLGNIGT